MSFLRSTSNYFIKQQPHKNVRRLFKTIDWSQQLIVLYGPPGSGKTTLIHQRIHRNLKPADTPVLYISAADPLFFNTSLVETAGQFCLHGGRHLFIDDLYACPHGETQLSEIRSSFPNLFIVSATTAGRDYSTRANDASTYYMPLLSFREYLYFRESITIEPKKLGEIITFHTDFAQGVTKMFQPLQFFKRYLRNGYYPALLEKNEIEIRSSLSKQIHFQLNSVLPATEATDPRFIPKIKQLLGLLLSAAPLKPNISNLSRALDVSRDSVYHWINCLERTELVTGLSKTEKKRPELQKPAKIYAGNPMLMSIMQEQPSTDSIRKTFLVNQLRDAGFNLSQPKNGDLYLNGMTFTIGGKKQVPASGSDGSHSIAVADDIEIGSSNTIPLWLFGLMG